MISTGANLAQKTGFRARFAPGDAPRCAADCRRDPGAPTAHQRRAHGASQARHVRATIEKLQKLELAWRASCARQVDGALRITTLSPLYYKIDYIHENI